MKQITVRLNDRHRMRDGVLEELKYVYLQDTYEWVPSSIKIGSKKVVFSIEDVGPNSDGKIVYDFRSGPVPGNSDRTITRYHGWRGTSDDISVEALGERRIKKITELKSGIVAVKFGRDISPDEGE